MSGVQRRSRNVCRKTITDWNKLKIYFPTFLQSFNCYKPQFIETTFTTFEQLIKSCSFVFFYLKLLRDLRWNCCEQRLYVEKKLWICLMLGFFFWAKVIYQKYFIDFQESSILKNLIRLSVAQYLLLEFFHNKILFAYYPQWFCVKISIIDEKYNASVRVSRFFIHRKFYPFFSFLPTFSRQLNYFDRKLLSKLFTQATQKYQNLLS